MHLDTVNADSFISLVSAVRGAGAWTSPSWEKLFFSVFCLDVAVWRCLWVAEGGGGGWRRRWKEVCATYD